MAGGDTGLSSLESQLLRFDARMGAGLLGSSYDFARLGIPGLTFSSRYLSGDDGKSDSAVKEWERDAEIAYVVQQGNFKGLGVKLRNYVYRSDFSRGRDSNRLYLTYDVALW